MAGSKTKTKQGKWVSQAAQAALLRYQPEKEGLATLANEAKEQYGASIAGAESSGRETSQAIRNAEPAVSGIFDRADASTGATNAQLTAALAALGPAAAGFKADSAASAATGSARLARERASSESSLQQQDVAAQSAPSFARTLAGQQLLKSLSKISQQQSSLEGQQGAAEASELSKLEEANEGRRVTERGQNITAQNDSASRSQKATEHQEDLADKRQARKEAAASGGTTKPLTLAENNAGASTIQQIKQFAAEGGSTRAERVAALTEGQPSQSSKNAKGETVKTPAIPAFKPDVLMSAALDWAEYGHLSKGTEHRLAQDGYNVQKLGIPRATQVGESVRKTGKKIQAAIGF